MARAASHPDSPLNDKQLAFVERYLVHFNGSQAAIEAGYAKSRARQTASELLDHPAVQYQLANRRRDVLEEIRVEAATDRNRILLEQARIAFFDIRKLYGDDGQLLPVSEWPADAAAAVTSIETMEVKGPGGEVYGEVRKIKQESKGASLDKLMRHNGMYEADNKQGAEAMAQSVRDLMGAAGTLRPSASSAMHDDADDDDD